MVMVIKRAGGGEGGRVDTLFSVITQNCSQVLISMVTRKTSSPNITIVPKIYRDSTGVIITMDTL